MTRQRDAAEAKTLIQITALWESMNLGLIALRRPAADRVAVGLLACLDRRRQVLPLPVHDRPAPIERVPGLVTQLVAALPQVILTLVRSGADVLPGFFPGLGSE